MNRAFKLLKRLVTANVPRVQPASVAAAAILDSYVLAPPSPENAVSIFSGEWASAFPAELAKLPAGHAALFEDPRIRWAIDVLHGVKGFRVLELGPLEGGHSYMLDRAGAAQVLAVESNTRAFLKCLIAKELLGMPSVRFVCGDFRAYLRNCNTRFDAVVASGVLYHMENPAELLSDIARVSDRLVLWTHYYDQELLLANPKTAHRVTNSEVRLQDGFRHLLYRHDYGRALNSQAFCGGSKPFCNWMTRDGIFGILAHFGLDQISVGFEQPDHPNGPALCLVATRASGLEATP